MKGNRNQPAVASQPAAPSSPGPKSSSKYTNKDGSKFITVPKPAATLEHPQASPTTASMSSTSASKNPSGVDPATDSGAAAPPVNRKKAKRRAKLAAKAAAAAEAGAASEPLNGLPSPAASAGQDFQTSAGRSADYSDDERSRASPLGNHAAMGNGHAAPPQPKSKKSGKKKNGQAAPPSAAGSHPPPLPHAPRPADRVASPSQNHRHHHHHDPHGLSTRGSGISKEKIWNTTSQEERERIKEYWLGLGEEERKSLVKIEKDAVLKKMKEQQKHTCSCTVCGRKRTAIEEELEGLYDAYYEELESFANQPNHHGQAPPMLGPPQHFKTSTPYSPPPVIASGYPRPRPQPSRGTIVEHVGGEEDEEEGEEDYSDGELGDEDDYSDDEEPEEMHHHHHHHGHHHPIEHQADFFNFGNSLTVQGGILTVADDLLKNDGKKFIEMMEQLAERRMAREEDAKEQYTRDGYALNGAAVPPPAPATSNNTIPPSASTSYAAHNHPPPPPEDEEEFDDEDEEEDYDSQEEDYDEEEDTMTEEQRMEEGRRMFQIFAARMFEQRVLTAYREKVAEERQEKLLEEIDAEKREEQQRQLKKAKDAEKRKNKKQQQKLQQATEKAKKDAERLAQEVERRAEEQRKQEELRQKADERKKKKEALRKAEEEERQRLRERQLDQERKAREAREREKKAKDEAKLREKTAREQKEREARERKERLEKERLEKEAKAKAEKEAREKLKREERAALKAAALTNAAPVPITLVKRPAPQASAAPALPQNPNHQQPHQQPHPHSKLASPQIPVATPAIPKVPTPMRPRQASQQEAPGTGLPGSTAAQQASGHGPAANAVPDAVTPMHMSPAAVPPLSKGSSSQGMSVHSQTASPLGASIRPAIHGHPGGPFGAPMPFPHSMPAMPGPPGFPARMPNEPMFPPVSTSYRAPGLPVPQGPPGLGMPIHMNGPLGRGFAPMPPPPPPGFSQTPEMPSITAFGSLPKEPIVPGSHSRHASAGFDSPSAPPIQRPAPIGRPGSVVQGQRNASGGSPPVPGGAWMADSEDLGNAAHLGSSALIDDSDEPLQQDFVNSRRMPGGARGFPPPPSLGAPFGMDPTGAFGTSPLWSMQPHQHLPPLGHGPFGGPPGPPPGFGNMPNPVSAPWGHPVGPAPMSTAFAPPGLARPSRSVQVRHLLCRACQNLADRSKPTGPSTPNRNSSDSEKLPQTPGRGGGEDGQDGFIPLEAIKAEIALHDNAIDENELLDMCDTEGNQSNGGGSFDVRRDDTGRVLVRWTPGGQHPHAQRALGAPGEIGSPVIGSGSGGGGWTGAR